MTLTLVATDETDTNSAVSTTRTRPRHAAGCTIGRYWQAGEIVLKFSGTEILRHMWDSSACVVLDISEMESANCVPFDRSSSASILTWPLMHYELSGCDGAGGDYSFVGGYLDSNRQNYFEIDASGSDLGAHYCGSPPPLPFSLSSTYNFLETEFLEIYLKGASPSKISIDSAWVQRMMRLFHARNT